MIHRDRMTDKGAKRNGKRCPMATNSDRSETTLIANDRNLVVGIVAIW